MYVARMTSSTQTQAGDNLSFCVHLKLSYQESGVCNNAVTLKKNTLVSVHAYILDTYFLNLWNICHQLTN